ncbi:MAG: preprotein translocase subunit YajC [Bowdeniella nasicola]|nr:preprotein translocase subunit YajC [Bowdeniella nasicola]
MDPLFMLLIVMLVMMLVFRYFGNKQAQKAKQRRDAALEVGTSVRTHAGYYGTIVDIDGETVTLESPAGDESVWHRNAIFGAEEPPFALPDDSDEFSDDEPEFGERLEDELEQRDDTDNDLIDPDETNRDDK